MPVDHWFNLASASLLADTLSHATRKPLTAPSISPPGTFWEARDSVCSLWALPLSVSGHHLWERAHHPGHHHRLPPPHPHVPLSLQPVIVWHLFHLHHHPKDAPEPPDPEQNHYLRRLHHPDVFFHSFWTFGQLTPDRDGLWPLRGHLPPPALHGHHEPAALCTVAPSNLAHQRSGGPSWEFNHVPALFLRHRWNPALLLWTPWGPQACLLWHLHQ